MEREQRYIVIKLTDLEKTSPEIQGAALAVCDAVIEQREQAEKAPLECVVVEKDWPEYDETWFTIARRVDKENGQPNALRSKLDQMERYGYDKG